MPRPCNGSEPPNQTPLLEWETAIGDNEHVRVASRYFDVYETGGNTTTEFGEPEPLDPYYGRSVNFGDDYVGWDELAESTRDGSSDVTECHPNNAHEDGDVLGTVLENSGSATSSTRWSRARRA